MILNADIKYKSNSQQGALKGSRHIPGTLIFALTPHIAKRRNKWICALKAALADTSIYGSKGNPGAPPDVARYTKVPWDTIQADAPAEPEPTHIPAGGWRLSDNNAVLRKCYHPKDFRVLTLAAEQLTIQATFSVKQMR